ncbi:branched-chain amino acid ABC transporter permease [Halorubrum sp. SD626R]|jgi:branched-chain amino acid transport system permease protein|uniref:branched-chain amino acid ABC transporter permease n=1 Tax=Halorubrum sp. SD626R TaxID=1419722 RepID=UPI000B870C4F|nr:branched-chain amino acid ABC transporter permease [Halorubrum sp. SD626R]TKX81831.1 branched-chain amino acid ABC transporter permease [Halorubrum sp. SD626R]
MKTEPHVALGISDTIRERLPFAEHAIKVTATIFGLVVLLDMIRQLTTGELTVALIASYLWRGLAYGLVIGLAGVGLSLTYDLLDFANFAHGDYITISAFVGWGVAYLVAGFGQFSPGSLLFLGVGGTVYPQDVGISVTAAPVAILVGLIIAALVGALLAVALDSAVYKSMRGAGNITLLIASVGVAFVLRYAAVFLFTQQTFGLTADSWSYEIGLPGGAVRITSASLLLIIVALVMMIAIHLLLTRTKLGKAMRAMGANQQLARVTGIPSEKIVRRTWLIGGALAGIAGFMIALLQGTINYQIGWTLLLLVFAGVIMGGIGSVYGAIVGGILVGLITRVSLIWIPASFTEATGFAVMILILLTRPAGIFGGDAT